MRDHWVQIAGPLFAFLVVTAMGFGAYRLYRMGNREGAIALTIFLVIATALLIYGLRRGGATNRATLEFHQFLALRQYRAISLEELSREMGGTPYLFEISGRLSNFYVNHAASTPYAAMLTFDSRSGRTVSLATNVTALARKRREGRTDHRTFIVSTRNPFSRILSVGEFASRDVAPGFVALEEGKETVGKIPVEDVVSFLNRDPEKLLVELVQDWVILYAIGAFQPGLVGAAEGTNF